MKNLPVDDWLLDAYSQSVKNPRFLSMYFGTDIKGRTSLLTRFSNTRDYGCMPLPPDQSKPYYGSGFKLDFQQSNENCAACHIPIAAVEPPCRVDPKAITGTAHEGVSCDFCHKIRDVKLDRESGLPTRNMPGVLSLVFRRPGEITNCSWDPSMMWHPEKIPICLYNDKAGSAQSVILAYSGAR